jgi:integrase
LSHAERAVELAISDKPELDQLRGSAPAGFEKLAETARDYARSAKAQNTHRAYAADWSHYTLWCVRHGTDPLPPQPQKIGLYLAACASGSGARAAMSVGSIERRLSGLAWNFVQRGFVLDRGDRHIGEVLAGIRRKHALPPLTKDAILTDDLLAMLGTLGHDLRGLRDRAILLIGFVGALRRSEITGLDCARGETEEGTGWVEIQKKGALLRVKSKTGWREVEVDRGSSALTCPVAALECWLTYSRIGHGPVFRAVSRDGKKVLADRLTDKHVVRLVQKTALAAGLRGDLPEGERRAKFGGHSLRAGLAIAAEHDERHVQKQLGHASAGGTNSASISPRPLGFETVDARGTEGEQS